MILLTSLVSGCGVKIVNDTYCDLSDTMWFGSDSVIQEMVQTDPQLLRQIVEHNEKRKAICGK